MGADNDTYRVDFDLGTTAVTGTINGNTGTDTLEINSDNADIVASFPTVSNFETFTFTGGHNISLNGAGTSTNPVGTMVGNTGVTIGSSQTFRIGSTVAIANPLPPFTGTINVFSNALFSGDA